MKYITLNLSVSLYYVKLRRYYALAANKARFNISRKKNHNKFQTTDFLKQHQNTPPRTPLLQTSFSRIKFMVHVLLSLWGRKYNLYVIQNSFIPYIFKFSYFTGFIKIVTFKAIILLLGKYYVFKISVWRILHSLLMWRKILFRELNSSANQWNIDGHIIATIYNTELWSINHNTNEEKWSEKRKGV
jgi:hypothetical protein